MLSSAATFAFFMSIGTVIRTDGLTMSEWAQREINQGRYIAASASPVMVDWRRRVAAAAAASDNASESKQ
jgi:hypothetical protein